MLWALLLLTAATFGWVAWVQTRLLVHGEEGRAMEARVMARSGITLGLHPLVTRLTPLPPEELASGAGYEIHIRSEGGKLNINWLMAGEEPTKIMIFKQWLERRGLDFQQRETLVDCLLDYIDADNIKRLNGAEDDGDYHPANRELRSVEELRQVRGTGPLTSQPGWQDELTVYSVGPIDLTSASPEVLELLPGLGHSRIEQFIAMRRGLDGIDGTPDDHVFPDLATVQQALALSPAQFESLRPLVTLNDPTLEIRSIGHSGATIRTIAVVARKAAGKPQVLSWNE
ncbi:MAG: type II secretion system protein GspK [Chthoniobacter sp.]|nr:type II secretion system protein GspK [Chthoniobacter sp.]